MTMREGLIRVLEQKIDATTLKEEIPAFAPQISGENYDAIVASQNVITRTEDMLGDANFGEQQKD